MRRARLNLVALAWILFGLSTPSLLGQSQILIGLTDQVWRYEPSGDDPGAFWDPLHDDSGWPEGRGVFAYETNSTAALNSNVYPYTNTVLVGASAGGPVINYFRTHFPFSGEPNNYVLTASNLIDDGYIMYLNGQEVSRFNMNAAGTLAAQAVPNEGTYVVRELAIPPDLLLDGDNVLAVAVYQNNATSSDVVWGTVLHAFAGYAPRFLSPTADVDIRVPEGRSTNLTVSVDAAPSASIQWYFDDLGPNPAAPISRATGLTYTVTAMNFSKEGAYYAHATNGLGRLNSPNFNVSNIPDLTPPAVVRAIGDVRDLTRVTVTFSENVLGANDKDIYVLEPVGGGSAPLSVISATYGASSNVIILVVSPRNPAVNYNLLISLHDVQDFFNNRLADPTVIRVTVPAVFQNGVAGYNATQDTEIRANLPDSASGGSATTINSDLEDPLASQTLVRFDNIIGLGSNQVPPGATVSSATLRLFTTDATEANTPIRMLRMLANWSEASTWNSMGNGIDQTNGVETGVTDALIDGTPTNAFDNIDVTAAAQDWVNGANNYGWALLATGNNGWRWVTSENATVTNRPQLVVEFSVELTRCNIEQHPQSITVNEKQPLLLSVLSTGSSLRYQWYKNNVLVPGSNAPTFTVARAIPADAGTYRVVVQNDFPSECISADAAVNVIPDLARPVLTTALGNEDQTSITLVFDDTLELVSAANPANYTLSGGLTITRAVVSGNTVTLTNSGPRAIGNNYTLTINSVRDDAVARNFINPNPTSWTLPQRFRVLPFNASWKYETNGLDLGTAWKEVAYDASAWPTGQGLFGLETNTVVANFAPYTILTPWITNVITWYLRSELTIPYVLTNATVTFRHITDDGALVYVNGAEVYRFNMPAGPITSLTVASSAATEGLIRSTNITGLLCGQPNTLAVEVHNQSLSSSDVLFGAEILVTVPSFAPCLGRPEMGLVRITGNNLTLWWTSGTLQESTDLLNWSTSADQANPQAVNPTGVKFYRVRVP